MSFLRTSYKKAFLRLVLTLLPLAVAALLSGAPRMSPPPPRPTQTQTAGAGRVSPELAAQLAQLEARERMIDQTVWAKELVAQQCGRTIESLWDGLNAATNKLALAAAFQLGAIVLGKWTVAETLPHGILLLHSAGPGSILSQEEWRRWIGEIAAEGWRLVQCEFRHNRFDTGDGGQPRQSQFYVSGHLTNALHPDRLVVEGNMVVDWAPTVQGQPASIQRVDVSSFSVKRRQGPPPFEAVLIQRTPLVRGKYSLGPLILYDLDGDGISEIILPSENRVYAKLGSSGSESHPLFRVQPRSLTRGSDR